MIDTKHFDLFYWPETSAKARREGKRPVHDTDASMVFTIAQTWEHCFYDVNDVIRYAIANEDLPRGSGRAGVAEIQTDQGIYTREGGNGFANGSNRGSRWSFKSWEQLEAEEVA